jgi:hypothetical protein
MLIMSRTQREKSQGKTGTAKLFGRNGRDFKRNADDMGDAGRKGGTHFLRCHRRHSKHTEDFINGYAD